MSKVDGGLSQIYLKKLPEVHWHSTWSLGGGAPDMNGCLWGREFWIENKSTSGWAVVFETGQIAWAERRLRAGGRTFVAVRRQASAGPRRGAACDELWLFKGQEARSVEADGLKGSRPLTAGWWEGGPAQWDWNAIRKVLAG